MEQSLWAIFSLLLETKSIAEEDIRTKEEIHKCIVSKKCKTRDSGEPGLVYVDRIETQEDIDNLYKIQPCLKEKTCDAYLKDDKVFIVPTTSLQECYCKKQCHIEPDSGEVVFHQLEPMNYRSIQFNQFNCPKN